jgi:hypothetical protein
MSASQEIDLSTPEFSPKSWKRRRVRPEGLDALPPDDELARKSREELDFVNIVMGNHFWLTRQLRKVYEPGQRVLEIGAGSGALSEKIVKSGVVPAAQLIGMDVTPEPVRWPGGARWVRGNVLTDTLPDAEILISNLLLHQFNDQQLAAFARRLPPSCVCLLAVEPLRTRMSLMMGHVMTWVCAMNELTVHDMVLSVHAGFRGTELPDALNLPGWKAEVRETNRGGYRMMMTRPRLAGESSVTQGTCAGCA